MKSKMAAPLLILAAVCFFVAYPSFERVQGPQPPPPGGQRPLAGSAPMALAVLDVGQGDAILIRSPEGKTALVDAGPHKELTAELLRRRGITSLDLVGLTHHHQDHYEGMEEVVRQFRPRVFLDNGSSHTTPHYLRLIEFIRDR